MHVNILKNQLKRKGSSLRNYKSLDQRLEFHKVLHQINNV